MRIVKLKPEHVRSIDLQDAQQYFAGIVDTPGYAESLAASPWSFAAIDGDEVLGCAGVYEVWEGRALAWALIGKTSGRHFKAIHRAVAGFLAQAKWRRIEMVVDAQFDAGIRWARLLGMKQEGLMRAYGPDGKDYYLFAKVQP